MKMMHWMLIVGLVVTCSGGLRKQANAQNTPNTAEQMAQQADHAIAYQKAVTVLLKAAQDKNPFIRSNAIEAFQNDPGRALPLTQRGLLDSEPVVRFAAVVTAGKLQYKTLVPAIKPLLKDKNASVRAAALVSLHVLGEKMNLTPLAHYLAAPDPGLRSNTAMLLGLIGDKSAVGMLKQAADKPMPRVSSSRIAVVRTQIVEAIARLGDDSVLSVLRGGVHSSIGEVQVLSINAIGAIGDEKGAMMLQTIWDVDRRTKQPVEAVEVRIAAGAAVARIVRLQQPDAPAVKGWWKKIEPRALSVVLAEAENERLAVRAQVAWALGFFRDEPSFKRLFAMIDDTEIQVRVAAAASIVRRFGRNSSEKISIN